MVVVIHSTSVGLVVNNGLIQGSLNWFYANSMRSFAGVAVIIFLLITGYFRSSTAKSSKRDVIKLTITLITYFIGILIFCVTYMKSSILQQLIDAFTCQGIYYHLWYIWPFLFVVLLSPFLNILLGNINKRQHITLLTILYISQSIFPYIIFSGLLQSRLLLFITLYIQGAYIRKYGINISIEFAISCYLLLSAIISYLNYLYNLNTAAYLPYFSDYTSILTIASAIFLFLAFEKWNYSSNIINRVSNSTYGAYLSHTVSIVLAQKILPTYLIPYENFSNKLFPLIDIQYVLLVASFSMLIEFFRQLCWNKAHDYFN
jgi:surface polysaccharide O-acyltransferase-like enzyme